jgi:hypothetical protein
MKRLTVPVLLVIGSVALGLALGELSLRLLDFSYPKPYLPDDDTGSRLRPGTEGWNRNEGEAYVRVNSDGLRDREHSKVKPPDTVRIAILGDSFAEALQVPQEATFWAHLERELNACRAYGRNRVEVINFGISGHGTAQQLLMLRHRAWEYSPDLVLLAFFPGNDVTNNSKALEPEKMRPFFRIEDGRLALDDSFLRDPLYRSWKRRAELTEPFQDLRVYQLLRKAQDGPWRFGKSTPVALALAAGGPDAQAMSEPGLDERVFRAPDDVVSEEAWTITERVLVALHEETSARGAKFLTVIVTNGPNVYPDESLRRRYAALLGAPDLLYPEKRIQQLGAQNGFEVLALAPDMQRRADATRTYFHGFANTQLGFGHWNAAGHEMAGKLIGGYLCHEPPAREQPIRSDATGSAAAIATPR